MDLHHTFFIILSLMYFGCLQGAPDTTIGTLDTTQAQPIIRYQDEIFEDLTNPERYNKRFRPRYKNGGNKSVVVNISISLQGIVVENNELPRAFEMDLVVRCSWVDPRLTFANETKIMVGNEWHVDRIWKPPLFPLFLSTTLSLRLDSDGRILHFQRVRIKLLCGMEYKNYPMDKQTCHFVLESGSYSEDDLILMWSSQTESVQLNDRFNVAGFRLLDYHTEKKIISYPQAGNFSQLVVSFVIQRELQHFFLENYIPSMLFVVTSWISFWLDIQAAPARIAVCLTSMLTLVTSTKSTREKIAPVSYAHSLDIWNFVCIAFVFCSMLQYAVVNFIYTKDKRQKSWKRKASAASVDSLNEFFNKPIQEQSAIGYESLVGRNSVTSLDMSDCVLTPQDIALNIDKKCRLLFPIAFLLFNIIYWLRIHF